MPNRLEPQKHTAWLLLAIYSLLIVVSSLHPFRNWLPLSHWSNDFVTAPLPPFITRTDITTNLLVYIPLGYLLALVLARPRHRGRGVMLACLAGMAFSLLLESLQQLSPGRIASNLDVFLNTAGALTGGILSLHHGRLLRARRSLHRWRVAWFHQHPYSRLGLWLLVFWGLAQFALLPVPGAGWLDLHLRPLDIPPKGLEQVNTAWFFAVALEMAMLGAFTACLLRPGRYVGAMLLIFLTAFMVKLLAATALLKLRVVGGVLSLETLTAFLLAFWILLNPWVARWRRSFAILLLAGAILLRLVLAKYMFLPPASILNIVGLAKAAASLWPYAALGLLLFMSRSRPRAVAPASAPPG